MEVDYDNLLLAQQLLERQAKIHAGAMVGYVGVECTISQADLGVLLAILKPLADLSVTLGETVFTAVQNVAQFSADAVEATINEYVAADEAASQAVGVIMSSLGANPVTFQDPRDSAPKLGDAETAAPDDYAQADGWAIDRLIDSGSGAVDRWIPEGFESAKDRVMAMGGQTTVSERNNPRSYLQRPQAGGGEIESLRWSAGPIIGGVDWVFEQLFHFSLVEDVIMKPFAGNWEAIERTSIAWTNLGVASSAMSENFVALPGQTASWTGEGSIQFKVAMDAIAGGLIGLSYACDYVSGLASSIAGVSSEAAAIIGDLLDQIAQKLMRIAVEAAIPVAGWIAGAVEIAHLVYKITDWVMKIYDLISMIVETITEFIESKEKLVQIGFVIEDFIEGLARNGVKAVTA